MQIRPQPVPHDGSNPTNSAEDHAIRHVNSIMYILPEVRRSVAEKKTNAMIQNISSPINEHVDGLKELKTRLKNMDAQLSVLRLREAFEKFEKVPSEENLTTVAREVYQLGSQLNIGGCHVASHVEEIRIATHVLANAVKKGDEETIQNQRHVIHMLMKNLITLSPEHGLHKDIIQLNQNHMLFRTISSPSHEEVLEWQKALNEFPPVT